MSTFIRLSQAQKEAILKEFPNGFAGERPSFEDYDEIESRLRKVPAPKISQKTKLKNTIPGRHGTEKWPAPIFIRNENFRIDDLPEGLALVSIFDSAGNMALHNAAVVAMTRIWDSWDYPAKDKWVETLLY